MNKFIRATEIIMVAIVTDFIFLLSGLTAEWGLSDLFKLLLILLPFLCSILFYMIIKSPSSKEKVAFNLFRIILLLVLAKLLDYRFQGGDGSSMFLSYVLLVTFLDAVFSVLVFYLIGWWVTRKQLSVTLGIRCKRVVVALMTSFLIITIPYLLINYWHYFDGSWSGTYAGRYSNDKVVLDKHYFCYNDVVEADFKVRNGYIVLDIDSIRIKENSSDLYSDSQKQYMLDDIIFLAKKRGIHLATSNHEMVFTHDSTHLNYTFLDIVDDSVPASGELNSLLLGTYVNYDTDDKLFIGQDYFCYNDVVEADYKYGDGAIVLDIDSIRIKENSSDNYTDSEKQQMLDEIIFLAERNGIYLATKRWDHDLYFYRGSFINFGIFHKVAE